MGLKGNDEVMLQRALELARETAAFASPNPTVGCVLVRHGRVIGEGAHKYDAVDHAEIVAMKDAAAKGESVKGATAYVTLEPCSHYGRTGPCADALIAAGVSRCVVAMIDPNPEVGGRGLDKLRKNRVAVDVANRKSEVATEARKLNEAFAFAVVHGRPFVMLKTAVSKDGFIAPMQREDRAPVWLTGEEARADVQRLRHANDALITGVGTVLADDPELTDRTGLTRRRNLLRVVLDSDLRTPLTSKIFNGSRDLVFVTGKEPSPEVRREFQARGAEIAVAKDLGRLLRMLQERNIRSVLVEAGSRVNGAFLRAGLVDKVVMYASPVELGEGVPFSDGVGVDDVLAKLKDVERVEMGGDVRVSGYLDMTKKA